MLSPSIPSSRAYTRALNLMGWSLVIFLGLFTMLSTWDQMIFAELLTGDVGKAIYGLISSVCYMAPFILGGVMFYLFNKKTKTQPICYSIKLPALFPLMILGGLAIITAAAYINSWFCTLIGYEIPPELIAPQGYDDASTVIMYMTIGLAPAFAEEFLFRGVIYGNLRPFGRTQAILISAALFALMHQNIGQTFYTFAGGVAMALMYELTGSIWCSVFFHLLNNELSVITEVLYYGKFGDAVEPLLMLWDVIVLVLGSVSILILILCYRKKSEKATAEAACECMTTPSRQEEGSTDISPYDQPVSGAVVLRGLLTPGIIVFTALAVVSMISTYLMIMFMDLESLL